MQACRCRDQGRFGLCPQGSIAFSEIGRVGITHRKTFRLSWIRGLSVIAGHKPHDPGVFAYSAHAAVVVVDPHIFGSVEVLDYAIVADCGTQAVPPLLVEGQIIGGLEWTWQCFLPGKHGR